METLLLNKTRLCCAVNGAPLKGEDCDCDRRLCRECKLIVRNSNESGYSQSLLWPTGGLNRLADRHYFLNPNCKTVIGYISCHGMPAVEAYETQVNH